MTSCSSPFIDSFYYDNLLTVFDNSIFEDPSNTTLESGPTLETQELFSKFMKRKSPENNTDFQALTKKARIESSPSLTSEVSKTKTPISPDLRPIIVGAINRILKATGESLEGLQTYYAKIFNVDPQDIKNVCSASTNCPTAKKTSEIKIIPLKKLSPLYLDLTSSLQTAMTIISPKEKKNLTYNINQISKIAGVPLEQIQISYANKIKVDLQDIKNIYSSVSNNCPTANETSEIEQIDPSQS